jgi:hypothetical protein
MKKILSIVFLITIVLQTAISQEPVDKKIDYNDENRRVYWFDVTIPKLKEKETGLLINSVRTIGGVHYGKAYEYDRYLWQGLSNGAHIAIGPFNTREQAEKSRKLYNLKIAENDSTLLNDNTIFFWYIVTIKKTKRLKSYDFERIPAQVAQGTMKDFIALQKASLPLDRLVIGVFRTAPDAENSKGVFRLEE